MKQYFNIHRFYTGLLTMTICVAAILSGCGESTGSSVEKREIPAPNEVSEDAQEAMQTPTTNQTKEEQIADVQKPTDVPSEVGKYKAASDLMTQISEKINNVREGSIDAHNKEHTYSDPQYIAGAMPILLYSVSPEIICAAAFSEDEMANNGIIEAAGYVGITDAMAVRNGVYDYTLTGKRFSDKQVFEVHCLGDPDTGGLRILENVGGTVTEFLEFIPLGDGKYAFQTSLERVYVTYCGGLLEDFVYTKTVDSAQYNSETDSIYPGGGQSGADWVEASGVGEQDEYIVFDGNTVKMSIKPLFGEAISAEVTVPEAGF